MRDAFEDNGSDLGYALLLKRYVDDPRQATPEQIDKAAWDTVPHGGAAVLVLPHHGGPRLVLHPADGDVLRALGAAHARRAIRWLLKVAVFAIPLPWIAVEAGWFVAEFGRQPWMIEGVLPTAAAVSNLGVETVLFTIVGFVADLHGAARHRDEADAQGDPQGAAAGHPPSRSSRRLVRRPQRPLASGVNAMILHQLIDYDTLRLIWWLLLGVLLIGFAVTDGFDLGVGMLLPFVGRRRHRAARRHQQRSARSGKATRSG